MALRQRAQPGELALGKLARGEDAAVAQPGHRPAAVERFPGLPVTDATHGRQVERQVAALAQGEHFVQQAAGQHRVEALRDALVQPGALQWLQRHHGDSCKAGRARGAAGRVEAAERAPRHAMDLERALDTLAVARLQPRCRGRVQFGQPGMHPRPADCRGLGFERGAHRGVGRRHVVQALHECLEIQHRPTHQQRQFSARVDLADQPLRVAREVGGTVRLRRVADVDQVVRHGRAFCRTGFRAADVHAAVHQRRVDADDLERDRAGDHQRRRALAGSRRPGQREAALRRCQSCALRLR